MTEWIAQTSLAAPGKILDGSFEPGARGNGFFHRCSDVGHHEVEMDRRPVSAVIAYQSSTRDRRAAGILLGQENALRTTCKLGDGAIEEPADQPQLNRPLVELNGCFQVRNVDVDQGLHERELLQSNRSGA